MKWSELDWQTQGMNNVWQKTTFAIDIVLYRHKALNRGGELYSLYIKGKNFVNIDMLTAMCILTERAGIEWE